MSTRARNAMTAVTVASGIAAAVLIVLGAQRDRTEVVVLAAVSLAFAVIGVGARLVQNRHDRRGGAQ